MKKKELKEKYREILAENIIQQGMLESQMRTIQSLMQGVEEHTGKEGTTPVLTYIARIEDERDFFARILDATGMGSEQLLEIRRMGQVSADRLFKAFENYDE